MSITTDPVRELTDLCQRIRVYDTRSGADYLAEAFDVQPWSTDFMLVLASIHHRLTQISEMIDETDLDDDIKQAAVQCLVNIRLAFSMSGLSNQWHHSIGNYLNDANLMPIRMTSAYVRPQHGYTVPDQDGVEELVGLIEDLLSWLRNEELHENDVIRIALIDGLVQFLFRVQRVGWFGWGNTIDSLKAVVAAYLALERGMPTEGTEPRYEAMVKKAGSLLKTVFERVKFAKEVQETGDWLLRGYGALSAVGHTYPAIAGLLGHG